MLEVDLSEATIEEVIAETIVESDAIVEAIEKAIEEVIEEVIAETIVESNALGRGWMNLCVTADRDLANYTLAPSP